MFNNFYVIVLVVCMVLAYFFGRWLGAIDKRRFVVAIVSYEEQVQWLNIKNAALQEELDETMCKNFHNDSPELDIANWSFEYWCQMQGMTEQEVQALSDDERAGLVFEWKDETYSWGG